MGDEGLYIRLVWLFVGFISVLSLSLCWLFLAMRRAQEGERESRFFARETVMAQERERSRLALELHDTVAQDLSRLLYQIDSVGKTGDAGERERLAAEVVRAQGEVIVRVRNICEDLVPPDFERMGLVDALRNLCKAFRKRSGIECLFLCQEGLLVRGLDSDMQLHCFRIVQECLSNTEKHAGATEASVIVRHEGEETLLIIVSDNGRGFENGIGYHHKDTCHFGVKGMYERAALLSGTLTVESETGAGTMVCLRVTSPIADKISAGG